jgi:Glycine-zipper domain
MRIHNTFLSRLGLAAGALSLGACMVMPTGPTTLVMPGRGATMDRFRFDDNECRQYAYYQIGGVTAQDAANQAAVGSAVVGTAVGALAGAAVGGSQGAAVGAGVGLVGGSAYGANSAYASGYGTQRQYNNAYVQCMYVKGHSVPVPAGMAYQPRVINNPQNWGIPPPPPGMPPPPPPR